MGKVNYYRIIVIILTIGFFLLPLIFWPWARIPYELPRVWFVLRWIEVVGLLSLCVLPKSNLGVPASRMFWIILGYIAWIILSSLAGSDWPKSLVGNPYRADGILTQVHVAGLVLMLMSIVKAGDREWIYRAVALGASGTGVWAAVVGAYSIISGQSSYYMWGPAVGISFGQPNFLAGYLLVGLPFIWRLSRETHRLWSWLGYFGMSAAAAAIVFTRSWAGIAGIGIFACMVLLTRIPLKKIWPVILALGIVSVGMLTVKWIGISRVPMYITAESRSRIFAKGALAFLQYPVSGWGWANFDHAFDSVDYPYKFNQDAYVDKAHSDLLEHAVTSGAVGLGIYSILLWVTWMNLTANATFSSRPDSATRSMLIMAFLLYMYHAQTNVLSIAESLLLWLIIATSTPAVHKKA